ncbi:MAG: hypothetical protein ACKPFD_05170 [Dolichospermum sp.]
MTQNNRNGQQGSLNVYGYEFTIVEKEPTGEVCRILQKITKKKIKPDYFRKQARNGKLEIPYYQGMLIAEIVDISPSNRRYWCIKLRPNTLFPSAA